MSRLGELKRICVNELIRAATNCVNNEFDEIQYKIYKIQYTLCDDKPYTDIGEHFARKIFRLIKIENERQNIILIK